MSRVLIADDEPTIRDVIGFALQRAGHTTVTARNGTETLQMVQRGGVDLVILDIGMPEMDGLDVCRAIRRTSDLPILFLSARDDEIDRVIGLELGGDDYVTKPFSTRELVARVGAILKRQRGSLVQRESRLAHGGVRLDMPRHIVTFGESRIGLTALEFSILAAMMAQPDMVFSREQIMRSAYDDNVHVSDRTIDSHIRNLRAKFQAAGCAALVETVHGVGFRLGSCQ